MGKAWLIGMPHEVWQGIRKKKACRLPPFWHDGWVNGFAKSINRHELFFSCSSDRREVFASGLTLTSPYVTPDGWTMEILLRCFFSATVKYTGEVLQNSYYFLPLCEDEFESLCAELSVVDKQARRKLKYLEKLAKREIAYDRLTSFLTQNGCASDEIKEVVKTLAKITNEYNGEEDLGELKQLVDYIAFLLHADKHPSQQWGPLWENLLNTWREFTTTLKPSEIKQLEKGAINLPFIG